MCHSSCFNSYHEFSSIIVLHSIISGFEYVYFMISNRNDSNFFVTLRFGSIMGKVNAASQQKFCPLSLLRSHITLKHKTLQALQCDGTQMVSRGQYHWPSGKTINEKKIQFKLTEYPVTQFQLKSSFIFAPPVKKNDQSHIKTSLTIPFTLSQ